MSHAIRNRAIKQTLESAFGKGKVRVRGSRGTGAGWVNVSIDWTPLDSDQSQIMHAHCKALLRSAGIDLGRTYLDDTCAYETDMCHIGFNPARYYRAMRRPDGSLLVLAEHYDSEWQTISKPAESAAAQA